MTKDLRESGSFRDDRGFLFWQNGRLLRQINSEGKAAYDHLMVSGLHSELVEQGLLIPHKEVKTVPEGAYKVIEPELVPFISYPYEWSFSQLQDAALATLTIQKLALQHGMTLRDASAYNVQFVDGKACLIDTLSFDLYQVGQPWIAYRQFCQHFLAPLALMSHCSLDLLQLMRVYIDGIPLSLANELLPTKSKLVGGLGVHIGLHARLQNRHAATGADIAKPTRSVSQNALNGILESLERAVRRLKLPVVKTEWGEYYTDTNYTDTTFAKKKALVKGYLDKVKPQRVLDLGANDGTFSRLAEEQAQLVISSDIDPLAVESNYLKMKAAGSTKFLPILLDLTNPSPALGWANEERRSFTARAQSDVVMALALIHHLAIGNNLPLELVAEYFAQLGDYLIIEFVPKQDSQVQRLLSSREDIFPHYTIEGFEAAFAGAYKVIEKTPIKGTSRVLYLMRRQQ